MCTLVIIYFNKPGEIMLNVKYRFQKQIEILLTKPVKILNRPIITFYNSSDVKRCK